MLPSKNAATQMQVIEKGQFFAFWIGKFASSGPYNVYAGPKDCGAVMLGPNKAVYSVAFDGPGLPLRKVLIPDAQHTCVDPLAPKEADELHLAKYGEPFGVDFERYVGVYRSATPGVRPGFVFYSAFGTLGYDDPMSTDSGG